MPLPEKSIVFYQELIDLIIKTPQNIRYDTLDMFAKRHGLSYDWVKKRAEVLAYATHGELARVPKSIRQDVRNIKEEMAKGSISPKAAEEASLVFLSKTPLIDLERLNRQYRTEDKEILNMQERLAKNTEIILKKMVESGVHPVRAYSLAWSMTGRKLNYEIPRALEAVPKDKLPSVMKDIWAVNFKKSNASVHYETARLDYLNMLRGFKRKAKTAYDTGPHRPIALPEFMQKRGVPKSLEAIEQRLESDRKNVQRYPRPGKERPFPRDVKGIAIDERMAFGDQSLSSVRDPFKKKLLELGTRLRAADKMYREAKLLEEEKVSPFVLISRKKRRLRA